mgnify:CR=1 FL=1
MKIEEKAAQIVVTAEVIAVASIDENGYPLSLIHISEPTRPY